MAATVFINGHAQAALPVSDRGLQYGDGVFETLLLREGKLEFLDLHLQRLYRACQQLKLVCEPAELGKEITAFLQQLSPLQKEHSVLKLIVTRGSGGRGYAPAENLATRVILLSEAPAIPAGAEQGIEVCLCETRLSINPALAGIKHLSRLENVLASAEIAGRFAEGLMFDTSGHLVEGTRSNLFLYHDGILQTPSLQRCGVEGVMRQFILEQLAPALSINTRERDITLPDLLAAESDFISNSLIGIWPIIKIGCHKKIVSQQLKQLQVALREKRGD